MQKQKPLGETEADSADMAHWKLELVKGSFRLVNEETHHELKL